MKILGLLGVFMFGIDTADVQEIEKRRRYNYGEVEVSGGTPVYQDLGRKGCFLKLTGFIAPLAGIGNAWSMKVLQIMADLQKPYLFVLGDGTEVGCYYIDEILETHSNLFSNGQARKIQFEISLKLAGSLYEVVNSDARQSYVEGNILTGGLKTIVEMDSNQLPTTKAFKGKL